MSKSKKQQPSIDDLPYDIGQIINDFIVHNCVPVHTMGFDPDQQPYAESEIRIVLHENGSGRVHVIGRDSQTIDFHLNSPKAVQWMMRPKYYTDRGLEKILSSLDNVRAVVRKEMENFQKSDSVKL